MNGVLMEQEEKRTVGQLLGEAREARGISREDAAAATHIKPTFLMAMEEDDYHLLPDERYLVRFLSEYAIFLGLDPETVQRRFRQQITRSQGSLAVFPLKRTVTLSLHQLLPGLLLLLFLVPSIFIGLSLLADRAEEAKGPERTGTSESAVAQPPLTTLPATRETFAANPIAMATPAVSDPPVPSDAEELRYTLRVRVQEMTWMLVTIDGEETHDVLLRAGETWQWRARHGFLVTVGNAGGVEFILNGRPLPRLGESGQVIRNLRLPPEAAIGAEHSGSN
ncbi:MAG: helix-turn-helix domain-containing protein [Candidatus Methylomirabilales bacterium]